MHRGCSREGGIRACCAGLLLSTDLSEGDPGLALASRIAELEDSGDTVVTVVIRMARGQSEAANAAIAWLGAHGRGAVLRTRVAVAPGLFRALREAHGALELQMAGLRPEVQWALLPDSDSALTLLRSAQAAHAAGVPVIARLAPLLPGLHDVGNRFSELVRACRGADIRDVRVGVPRSVGGAALTRLRRAGVLNVGEEVELARTYGLVPGQTEIGRLRSETHEALQRGFASAAAGLGSRVKGCCEAYCELRSPPPVEEISSLQPELFPEAQVAPSVSSLLSSVVDFELQAIPPATMAKTAASMIDKRLARDIRGTLRAG